MQTITVILQDTGKRVDKYLEKYLPDFSRREIRRMLRKGEIRVNSEVVATNFLLEGGDEIVISPVLEPVAKKKHKRVPVPRVLKETDSYVVIDKPAGLAVHPGKIDEKGTLRDWILKKYPQMVDVGENSLRPGMMQRLDKDVSGVMVLAKTRDMYAHLKQQFQKHTVEKEYIALLYGKLLKQEGVVARPIARSSSGHRMAARTHEQEGKKAITEYVVEEYVGRTSGEGHGFSLVRLTIQTGRTHQIRAHMQSLGHPVVGDNLYRLRKQKKTDDLARLFLHAYRLSFDDMSGKRVEVVCEPPGVLENFLQQVR